MFFSFLAVFPLPESYQNDPKFHFNTLLRSDTQKSSKNVENTTVFWSRCETVFAPPQLKLIKGSLGGETSVLRTFRLSGKELVKERVSQRKS